MYLPIYIYLWLCVIFLHIFIYREIPTYIVSTIIYLLSNFYLLELNENVYIPIFKYILCNQFNTHILM
jgi:hypothetical protein